MTPEEITKTIDEEVAANLDRICGPYEKHITELRRQLKWCHRVLWFMQGCSIVFAIGILIWALS
jgi:hypothetical protein